MIKEYVTSQHLTQIAETIQTYVDYKYKELESKVDYIDISYEELVSLRNEHDLQPGCFYCISDYVTTTSIPDTCSAGHDFPIVVLATSDRTLSEEAKTNCHDGYSGHHFSSSNLDAWKIWYCLDNDTDRFAWAGSTKTVFTFNYFYELGGAGQFVRDESLLIENSDMTYYGYTWVGGTSEGILSKDTILWYNEEIPEITDDYVNRTFYIMDENYNFNPFELSVQFKPEEIKNGKGVIYRMIDEYGNDCPYDFKNIMFKRPNAEEDENYYFTFSWVEEDGNIIDTSISGNNGYLLNNEGEIPGVFSNVIGKYIDNGVNKLPVNVFISDYNYDNGCYYGCRNNSFGNGCYNNSFGNGCYNNSFGNGCYNNSFGNVCYNNSFGNDCYSNTLDNDCYNNSFGYGSNTNILDNDCYNNSFGNDCFDNKFGNDCTNNSFGNYCYTNTLGNNCNNNSFGSYCSDNLFGNRCHSNIFGNSCGINNFEGLFLRNNYISDGCARIDISGQTDKDHYIQNLVIAKGISNSNTRITIPIPDSLLNADYEIKVAKNSSGELKIYCESDLIA